MLWGYPELLREYFENCYEYTAPTYLGEKLVRDDAKLLEEVPSFDDGHSEIWRGKVTGRLVAFKVMKFIGTTDSSKATLDVSYIAYKP